MPEINLYLCEKCNFHLCPPGWGGYLYVIDDNGNRIPCGHPGEYFRIIKILGNNIDKKILTERVGYNSHSICLNCLEKFEIDIGYEEKNKESWRYYYYNHYFKKNFKSNRGIIRRIVDKILGKKEKELSFPKRDERKCPKCGSTNVKTIFELIGKTCPKCKQGIIKKINIGIIS